MIATTNYENLEATAAAAAAAVASVAGSSSDSKRPYFGKCQYKTGKCFNERTLKRNGDAHSLCEEHRVKQNLIQRRSDRKYQTVHAIRRRERSQRRAVLKKQVSMAVAQQLFFEHQQQKGMDLQQQLSAAAHSVASLATPIQIPDKTDLSHFVSDPVVPFLAAADGLASPILSFPSSMWNGTSEQSADSKLPIAVAGDEHHVGATTERQGSQMLQQRRKKQRAAAMEHHVKDESNSPTGIDDFAPDSFLTICAAAADNESDAAYTNLVPIMTSMGERELWTEDDIDFLQNLLLA